MKDSTIESTITGSPASSTRYPTVRGGGKRRGASRPAPADAHPAAFVSRHSTMLLLSLASLVLLSLIFEPIGFWPAAFVGLVPWIVYVGGSEFAPRVYLHSFLLGLAFFLVNMQWMHHADWGGYAALAAYQAAYFPLIACTLRHVVRRRRWSLAWTLPLVWVGCEMVRAMVLSGFPWFYLSHGFYRFLSFIQISDVVGAYGVSFVVAACNGAIGDVVFARLNRSQEPSSKRTGQSAEGGASRRRAALRLQLVGEAIRTRWRGVAFAFSLVVGSLIYGGFALRRDTVRPGPRVTVLQGDYLIRIGGDEAPDEEKKRTYFEMLAAAAETKPDLYLMPETPWIMYLNSESRTYRTIDRTSFQALQNHATSNGAYLITGSASLERKPFDLTSKERHFNSAMVFHPDGREPDRYDKVHLVYFGETLPFRFGKLRFLYLWLNSLVPFSGADGKQEYSLFPGTAFDVFEMAPPSQAGSRYRFGIPICYEDVMPYVARAFVSGGAAEKQADFLLNISNDGWFGRGHQQWQHLATCVFRAIENRVGIARAVNTGVSGFIDPRGRVYDLVDGAGGGRWPRSSGYRTSTIYVDSRYTLYSRFGDWFGWLCAGAWAALFADYWVARARMG